MEDRGNKNVSNNKKKLNSDRSTNQFARLIEVNDTAQYMVIKFSDKY